MKYQDEHFRRLVLISEIAAMLHDIGKYSMAFMCSTMKEGAAVCPGKDLKPTPAHAIDFFSAIAGSKLANALDNTFPFEWPGQDGNKIAPLQHVGDLANWHHAGKGFIDALLKKGQEQEFQMFPTAVYLIMIADSIDSSSAKGNITVSSLEQAIDNASILTPFGIREHDIKLPIAGEEKQALEAFHNDLARLISDFSAPSLTVEQLVIKRDELLDVLREYMRTQLAETRIPRNDVSLWQHCYYTASIFKAMLAGRALYDNWDTCAADGSLAHYREKLGILGICWSQDELVSRAFRPKDILGRLTILDNAVSDIKTALETDFCLGNEIFRNRDGIFFLVPSPDTYDGEAGKGIKKALDSFCQELDTYFNSTDRFGGELQWSVRCMDIGHQILRLADVIHGDGTEEIASGPARPQWISLWDSVKTDKEICPRCGLRPLDLMSVSSGSEADRDRLCSRCRQLQNNAADIRRISMKDSSIGKMLGVGTGAQYHRYDLSCLIKDDPDIGSEENRLVLIQGVFNQQPLQSGKGFSSMFALTPEIFQENREYTKIDSWEKIFSVASKVWESAQRNGQNAPLKAVRQLFTDNHIGKKGDGRVQGETSEEKFINFINDIVLPSPFADEISDDPVAKIINYALRMHPAPSRLARMWETTERYTGEAVKWCEENKVPYTPISRDSGSFMLIVSAARAWRLLVHLYEQYVERFGKVRHILPLHLSATVFFHKSPLYVAIDAARRFRKLAMSQGSEKWSVQSVEQTEEKYRIEWNTDEKKKIVWNIPAGLPNGREDVFFTWFWTDREKRHPLHLSELMAGDIVNIFPSSFDYEVLDATVRRYDIHSGRPHGFVKKSPRPYPLAEIEKWDRLARPIQSAQNHQVKQLIGQLEWIHRGWYDPAGNEDFQTEKQEFISNAVSLAMPGKDTAELSDMGMEGSLIDLIEWCDLIRKNEKQ